MVLKSTQEYIPPFDINNIFLLVMMSLTFVVSLFRVTLGSKILPPINILINFQLFPGFRIQMHGE